MKVKFPDGDKQKLDEALVHAYIAQKAIHPLDQARAQGMVEGTLCTGVSKPTLNQKAGFLIFGGFFVLAGFANIESMYERNRTFNFASLLGLAFMALGVRVASNAFRTRKKPRLDD